MNRTPEPKDLVSIPSGTDWLQYGEVIGVHEYRAEVRWTHACYTGSNPGKSRVKTIGKTTWVDVAKLTEHPGKAEFPNPPRSIALLPLQDGFRCHVQTRGGHIIPAVVVKGDDRAHRLFNRDNGQRLFLSFVIGWHPEN